VACLRGANSTEFEPKPVHPVIDFMPDQRNITDKGATMRLGAYPCVLSPGTRAEAAYGVHEISERHRHRYEVNNEYRERLSAAGLVFSGASPDNQLVEMIELRNHPYFVGCQFHPEFKSAPALPIFHRSSATHALGKASQGAGRRGSSTRRVADQASIGGLPR